MSTEDLFIDRPTLDQLANHLDDLAGWLTEALDDTVVRQAVIGDQTPTRRRLGDDTPVPFNEHAADIAHEIHGTLRAWVEHVCQIRHLPWPGEQRTSGYAAWLNHYRGGLAMCEDAMQAVDEINDCHRRAMRAVDRPNPGEFVGPCQSTTPGITCPAVYCRRGQVEKTCRTCEVTIDIPTVQSATEATMRTRLFDRRELRTAMRTFGHPIPRQTLDTWIRRGQLADHAGRYRLDEALALAAQREARRTTRSTA